MYKHLDCIDLIPLRRDYGITHCTFHHSNKLSLYSELPNDSNISKNKKEILFITLICLVSGLVTGVDKSVGKVVEALAEKNMLKNTLIIFVSDNGAQSIGISRNYGSNLPLRGAKGSPWEGAVRSTAVLWHLNINPKIWKGMFHVTDWLPTLVTAAGGHVNHKTIDGVNQWYSITKDEVSKRRFAVIAVDDWNKWGAFRDGDYKIIIGNVPNTCGYYGHELSKLIYKAPVYEDKLLASKTSQVFSTKLEMGLDVSYALEKRDLCNLNKRKLKLNDTAMEIRGMCVPTQGQWFPKQINVLFNNVGKLY